MNQIIYLLRHGETVFNTQGRYQGELDSSLTAEGIGQVKNISKLLKMVIKDPGEWEIISSPLGRAMQSTEIICETLSYDMDRVITDDRLREVSVGDWAGLTIMRLKKPGQILSKIRITTIGISILQTARVMILLRLEYRTGLTV